MALPRYKHFQHCQFNVEDIIPKRNIRKNTTSLVITGLCLTVLDVVTSRPISSDLSVRNLLHSSPVTAIMPWPWVIKMDQNVHCTALGIFFYLLCLSDQKETLQPSRLSPCKIPSQHLLVPLIILCLLFCPRHTTVPRLQAYFKTAAECHVWAKILPQLLLFLPRV